MHKEIFVEERYVAHWLMPFSRRELYHLLQGMLDVQDGIDAGEAISGLELYLVDDAMISEANAAYMGCPGPTNILSFPGGADLAGTLLLSLDTLERECVLYGQRREEHCIRLLAHGLAHLRGLEHGVLHDHVSSLCVAWAIRNFVSQPMLLKKTTAETLFS